MQLIDKETAYKELSEYYHHNEFIQHLALSEALDRVPVVDAVPVSYIQDRIDRLRVLAEYEAEANGGYIGRSDMAKFELEELIKYWKAEREQK